MRNIHKYSYYKRTNEQKQRTQTQWGGRRRRPPHWGRRRRRRLCVLCFCSFICLSYAYLCILLIYLRYEIIRNTGAAFGGAPMGRPPSAAAPLGLCFWLSYIINIYGYSLYIPYIFHIYFLNMFHIFSLVCFLIYGVKSRSGHDRSKIVPLSA